MEIIVEEIIDEKKAGKVIGHYHNVEKNSIIISNDKIYFRYTYFVTNNKEPTTYLNHLNAEAYDKIDYDYYIKDAVKTYRLIDLKDNILVYFKEVD